MAYSEEIKNAAKSLYLRKWTIPEIRKELNLPNDRIVYYWSRRYYWHDLLQTDSVENALERRLCLLIEKDNKTATELNEMDKLFAQRRRAQKPESQPANESQKSDSGSNSSGTDNKKKKRRVKNDISELTAEGFAEKFAKHLYGYQRKWREHKLLHKIRQILKSRQIGATWYFAAEAFEDAVLTGDNQIFLSASKAQAQVFRQYIQHFALDWFGIELKGRDTIELSNGAILYFLSSNSRTAQSYHGHVYMDEYFWMPNFSEYNKVASAMATHKKYRKTYFSTPSVIEHEAHPMWSGEKFNERNRQPVEFPSFKELQKGVVCPDGAWRNIVTVEDAANDGCDLFDIDQLKQEYSAEEFANLFGCQFIDTKLAIFALRDLQAAISDASKWKDYNPSAERPFGSMPVWLGYDPSRMRDNAVCVVIAPPMKPGGKFRVLEKHIWHGQNFTYQAEQIKTLTERFNVQHIGVDTTGIGSGVFDMVTKFFPAAHGIHYGIDSKGALVLKAQNIIQNHRAEWDAKHTDIAHAFLTIKRAATPGGQVTYSANRTEKTGHGDVAWAIMHALIHEPLDGRTRRSSYAMAA